MDTALTAVEKEVYNLSLQIAHLDTAEDFARTKAKLQFEGEKFDEHLSQFGNFKERETVSVDFVRVNFPATSRTKALEASIATLLRTLTVLEEKSLSKSSASPSYKETRRVTVKSSRSYDSSASSSQRRSSADAKPSLVYDKGWEETSEYARAEKRRHTPSPELPRRQSRHEDIPLLSRTRSPSPPPQREYQRVTEREESYRRSLRDRSAYDADAYSPDHRRHERALYRSRSRERRDDRYDREAYREDTRRSHDDYREDSYRRSDRSPERKDARRDRYRDQQDVYSRETEYPRESYPPAPAPEYTYEPPPSSAYAYTQPVSAPPPAYSYLPPAANPYSLPPPPQMAFPPPVASQPLFPITLPPPQQTFPTIPATLSNTPPILKSALKKTSAPSQPTWENNSFAVPTVAEVPPPAQSEVTPVTEADRILDEMSSEEATRTLIFSDLSPKTMDIAFKILLLHYGPIESYEFYIWPGVTHRGAKVVYESLHSSVTAKVRMSGIEHLGSIIQVSFGNLVVGKVLFLEDVPADFNHDDITSKFRLCGRVTRVSLFAQRAIAMVFYEDEDTALRALSYMRMNSKQAAGIKASRAHFTFSSANILIHQVDMCRASDYAMFGEQPPETEAMSAATPTVPSSLDQRIERLNSGLLPSVEPSSSLVSVPTNESMSSTGLRSIELNPFATGLNPELDLIIEGIPVAPDDYKVKPAITAHFATYTSKVIVRLYATSPTNAFRFAVVRFDRQLLSIWMKHTSAKSIFSGKRNSLFPLKAQSAYSKQKAVST
ncbi:hypothetical protein CAPTEDRAFT_185430 [Capitella teleta]|uniref:RRM domain-containing protein n=1 Tax=Capitella teleta TaxID=283909 RepID=R7UNL4_CAPTE|nr:hypothetical protein CAPTEDRAFT_185430 [Capitella teleta]|eukprot:ELU08104.1 hypothetical protein CAPTEDRAFT_185430 [Capitella teleta]